MTQQHQQREEGNSPEPHKVSKHAQHLSPPGNPSPTPESANMIPPLNLPLMQRDVDAVSTSAEASSQVNIKNHKVVRAKALAYFERRNKQEPDWLLDRYGRYLESLNQTPRAGCDDNSRYVALMQKAAEWPELKVRLMCEVKSELTNVKSRFLLSAQGDATEQDAPDGYVCGPRDLLDETLRKVFSPPKFTSLDEYFISEKDFNNFVMVVVDYIFHNLAEQRAMCEAGGVVHLPNVKSPAHWKRALYDPLDYVDMRKSEFGWDHDGVWEPNKRVKTQNWPTEKHIRKILFNGYELRLECHGEQVNALGWWFNNGCVMQQVFPSPVDTKGKLKYGKKTDRPAFIEMLNKLFGSMPSKSSASGSASNERIDEFKKLLLLNNESIKPVVIMSCDGAWAAHAHLGVCEFLRQNLEVLGEEFWTTFSELALTPRDIFQILAEVKFLKCVEGAHIYESNNKQNPVSREHVISAWLSEFTSAAGKTEEVKDQVKKVIGRVLDCPFTDTGNKPVRKRTLARLTGLLRGDVDFNNASKSIAEHVGTLAELLHSSKSKKSKAKKRPADQSNGPSKQIQKCLLALCKACDEDAHAVPQIIDRYQVLCYQVRYKSRVEKLLKLVLHDGGDSNSSSAQGESKLTDLLAALKDAGYLRVAECLRQVQREALVAVRLNEMLEVLAGEDSAGRSVAPVMASCEELVGSKQAYLNLLCQACGEDERKKKAEGKTIDQIIEMMERRGDACSPTQQNSEACDLKKSPTNMPSPPPVRRNFQFFPQALQGSSPGNVNAAPTPVFPTAQRAARMPRMQKLMMVGNQTGLRQDSHQGVGECSMLKPHGLYKPADHAANLHNQQRAMYSQFQYLEMLRKSENPASETQMDVAEQVLNWLLYRFQVSMQKAQEEKPVGSPTLSNCLSPPLSPTPTP